MVEIEEKSFPGSDGQKDFVFQWKNTFKMKKHSIFEIKCRCVWKSL